LSGKENPHKVWFIAFLMLLFATGCGDPDRNTETAGLNPAVASVSPPNGATGVCSLAVITATFSEAMNPATINTTTFTVSPGVTGIITHDVTNTIFIFTPSSPLAVNTVYTATLTTGVRDTFGNALATDFVWSFRTASNGCNPPLPWFLSLRPSVRRECVPLRSSLPRSARR
jgi:hypothetical protein